MVQGERADPGNPPPGCVTEGVNDILRTVHVHYDLINEQIRA
jgi:hypothetical protein